MVGKLDNQNQRNFFTPSLVDFINPNHELAVLSAEIDWQSIENELGKFYLNTGKPSMPIRFMVGCLLLKRVYNLGDETLADAWVTNPYMQFFTGEGHFQHSFPCDPSDFVHFRKRIGVKGIESIFALSVKVHGRDAFSKTSLSDTTVQENNTTFPTDAKLAKKVIDRCNGIAKGERIAQRQSYTRVSKQLVRDTFNSSHPKRAKKARSASKKLKTVSARLLRELERNMDVIQKEQYQKELTLMWKIVNQKRDTKDKVYSLYKPFTSCIAKGKAHKKYEFGNKTGLMINSKNLVIQAIDTFSGNPHDSRTIAPLLRQAKRNFNYQPKEVVYDRGGKGIKKIYNTEILTPSKPLKKDKEYTKRQKRKKFRRRAAIEPVISHLKEHFRMGKNYLWGTESPKLNALLAASGWNLKKRMAIIKESILWPFQYIVKLSINPFKSSLQMAC